MPIVIVGTRQEYSLGENIRSGEEGIVNLCGATDLPGLVAVLSRAVLLVSNDSGAMHVMAALRRPQVAIFGSTSPKWTGPLNPAAAIMTHDEPCAPCFRRTCRFGHYNCLVKLSSKTVLKKASTCSVVNKKASPYHVVHGPGAPGTRDPIGLRHHPQ